MAIQKSKEEATFPVMTEPQKLQMVTSAMSCWLTPVQFGMRLHKNLNTRDKGHWAILEAGYHNVPVDNPQLTGNVSQRINAQPPQFSNAFDVVS